ncbi:MAG: Glycosyltransferase [Candidatus Giovannonibacteria bacterium GW2011_GWA2_45_21]|uniref:Glycosyltransferase n=1 Tax=Candidatus Giovannonibacteria bacterium GW2011_GWA2_45_21 TaxID=1618649 RepID=A0A0G1M957_9BACT|nr:MAG: Glycosyltransferase [Candidatus Giovannonibacteria bacterium GW2011_GWA2_45_21]
MEEITKRLAAGGFSFDLLTVNLDGCQKRQENIGGVNIFRIGKGGLGKLFFPFSAFFLALRLHKKNHYDATWAIMANYAGFAALFFKIFEPTAPFILTLQEGDPLAEIKRKVWFVSPLFKMIFRRADKVTAISDYLARWGKKMGAKNVEIVPNGVNIEKFKNQKSKIKIEELRKKLGFERDDTVLITTGRLVKKNGVEDIIAALKFLPEKVKLLIVGIGELEESLKSKVQNRVQFVGFVQPEKLPEYLWASDIFVRPSLSEGLGNSFIEAMAAGLPIIGTPVGGIPDFLFPPESSRLNLESGKRFNLVPTGLFCEPNNPQSIAEKVKLLLSDNSLREKIIANAQKLVAEKYDWDLIAEKMRAIL